MLKEVLLRYVNYNVWANDLLFTLTSNKISEDMLDRPMTGSFPSLRKTIYHIWDAESIWLKRLNGESITDWPSKSFNGSFNDAKNKIRDGNLAFVDFIQKSTEEKLSSPFSYYNLEGKAYTNPAWESVLHCMNHSTYHRGQVVNFLRQLGVTDIPSTDFISFIRIN